VAPNTSGARAVHVDPNGKILLDRLYEWSNERTATLSAFAPEDRTVASTLDQYASFDDALGQQPQDDKPVTRGNAPPQQLLPAYPVNQQEAMSAPVMGTPRQQAASFEPECGLANRTVASAPPHAFDAPQYSSYTPQHDARLPHMSAAHLPDALLPDAQLHDAQLPDTHLPDTHLPDAHLPEAHQHQAAYLRTAASQHEAWMPDVHLPDAHLSGARLPGAHPHQAYLPTAAPQNDVRLPTAHPQDARVPDARLYATDQRQPNLPTAAPQHEARLSDAHPHDTRMPCTPRCRCLLVRTGVESRHTQCGPRLWIRLATPLRMPRGTRPQLMPRSKRMQRHFMGIQRGVCEVPRPWLPARKRRQ
jgi:uncharacterized protein YjbI with pentapeptide repeats